VTARLIPEKFATTEIRRMAMDAPQIVEVTSRVEIVSSTVRLEKFATMVIQAAETDAQETVEAVNSVAMASSTQA